MEFSAATINIYVDRGMNGLRAALARVDDTTVNQRPNGSATNSVAVLVVHACAAARYWIEHVGAGRPTARVRDDEFTAVAGVEELHAIVDAAHADVRSAVIAMADRTGEPDLVGRPELYGGDRSDGALVLHALEELLQHLGHVEATIDALEAGAAGAR